MPENAILESMLSRLFASMAKGPALNCRLHNSRQRVDLTLVRRMEDASPESILKGLLGSQSQVSMTARVPMPAGMQVRFGDERSPGILDDDGEPSQEGHEGEPEPDPRRLAWLQQKSLLTKLRNLSDDARTYLQDTGVHALHLGYPILSLPPVAGNARVLAPIAFVPVSLSVRSGHRAGFDLACHGEGIDRVILNAGLMAWLERQTGEAPDDLVADESGDQPWQEIAAIIRFVHDILDLAGEVAEPGPDTLALQAVPKADALPEAGAILPSAVLGLFPATNESLVRDTQAMIEDAELAGPVLSFISSSARLESDSDSSTDDDDADRVERSSRSFGDERFVVAADPCQARTVAKARESRGLVIHGPPGTGKSQTITNIIGDHLARGERVLFVCEKRTALDVVANRLAHIGLDSLSALVHDPKRDQRDLYMSIRGQLESLPNTRTNSRAESAVEKIDEELRGLHRDLSAAHRSLMESPDNLGHSFHELMGMWLSIPGRGTRSDAENEVERATLEELDDVRGDIEVIMRRGASVEYARNLWTTAAGVSLDSFMTRSPVDMRQALASSVEDARAADATAHETIPPFEPTSGLHEQAAQREEVRVDLQSVVDQVDPERARRIADQDADALRRLYNRLQEAQPHIDIVKTGPLDAELLMAVRDSRMTPASIRSSLNALNEYLAIAGKWHAFLRFIVKGRAARVLRPFGLSLSVESAEHFKQFLMGLRARQELAHLHEHLEGDTALPREAGHFPADDAMQRSIDQAQLAARTLRAADGAETLAAEVRSAMSDFSRAPRLLEGLRRSGPRAAAVEQLERSMSGLDLLNSGWLEGSFQQLRAGRTATESLKRLEDRFDTIEDVLRIRQDLSALPPSFRGAVVEYLVQGLDAEESFASLQRAVLAGELRRRIAADSTLRSIDGERIGAAMERYRHLEKEKQGLVRDLILHRWRSTHRERLLVSTGSRLNSEGARLRQRLYVRGKRAMRLRQVIALGQETEDGLGDPLFDLCPVWMASPDTVAQVFPRSALFDVVVFDEASQCKLEEALPVLTRGKRVVIAGDPKQLPPTRFFEASITESDDIEVETDQDLFEAQQADIEDVLTAALNLEIEESYLDVHYRSRNADLIEFSNQQFYRDRLQAIPGHPSSRARFAPITLYRADGVYDNRCNPGEAKRVCEIVRDLLRRADPPSIGIACFNLTQRDLILEMLADLALEDDAFADRLAEARERRGDGSFEGLFVKNLESVQGDERDHIIISTTYGRNPEGKFYRRFGPLGMRDGGRRLNVLVTRARYEVHLVTSIPREAYISAAPVPAGQTPNGGWLLFAYLRYAEELAALYEQEQQRVESAQAGGAKVLVREIEPFSPFALGLGRHLAARGIGSDVHWGNSGFRVDLALRHPHRAEDVTMGMFCDFAQFPYAPDAVEWDLYRTGILEWQGWRLERVWSPHFFRDADRTLNSIEREVDAVVTAQEPSSSPRD